MEFEKTPLENLAKKIEIDPFCGIVLPLTIATHKFESKYQDFSKPRVLIRDCDEDGFTQGMELNKIYKKTLGDELDLVIQDLNQNVEKRLIGSFKLLENNKNYGLINAVAITDSLENWLYDIFSKIYPDKQLIESLPPLFERTYTKQGFPEAIGINSHCLEVHTLENNRKGLRIKGVPISDQDLKEYNLDDVFNKLINYDEGKG